MRKILLFAVVLIGVCYVSSCNTTEEMEESIEQGNNDVVNSVPLDTIPPSLLPFYQASLGLMHADVGLDSIRDLFTYFVYYADFHGLEHDSLYNPTWDNINKAAYERFDVTYYYDTIYGSGTIVAYRNF